MRNEKSPLTPRAYGQQGKGGHDVGIVVVLVLFRVAVVVETGRKEKAVEVPISSDWSLKSWDH
jgi:hypothetical protein